MVAANQQRLCSGSHLAASWPRAPSLGAAVQTENADAVTGYEVRELGPAVRRRHGNIPSRRRQRSYALSYEGQARVHRRESASAWWPVSPSKGYVE